MAWGACAVPGSRRSEAPGCGLRLCLTTAFPPFLLASSQVFRILELGAGGLTGLFGGRPRKCTLQAGSVEDSMDWTLAIREAITACTGQ